MTTEIIQQVPRYEVNEDCIHKFYKVQKAVLNYKNLNLAQWLRGIVSNLSKEGTLGPAHSVRLRMMSVLWRVK